MNVPQATSRTIGALWKAAKGIFYASAIYGVCSGINSYTQNRSPMGAANSAVSEIDFGVAWSVQTFFRAMPRNQTVGDAAHWVTFPIVGVAGVGAGAGAAAMDGAIQLVVRGVNMGSQRPSGAQAARP